MPPNTAHYSTAVARLAKGEEAAFREIFEHFSPKVHGYALRIVHSAVDAEELVQEVFLKLWLNRERLANVENFDAYLFTIARNATYNYLKRISVEKRARLGFAEQVPFHEPPTEEAIIYGDYAKFLHRAIERLSPQQRLIYNLCHREGMKYDEVAAKLKISKFTVKTHMQQALRSIKMQLRDLATACWMIAFARLFF